MERAQLLQFLYSKFYLHRICAIEEGISCSEFKNNSGFNGGINQSELFNRNSEARGGNVTGQMGRCWGGGGNSYKQMTAGVCLSVRKDGELAQSRWMKILSLSGFLSSDRL